MTNDKPHDSYVELCRRQVVWYRRVGRHAERVRPDSSGVEYVVGDWSWNRTHANDGKYEAIESRSDFPAS